MAERGSLVGSGKAALWMKEVRKLTENGHQVSLIATAYGLEAASMAAGLFSRWCQENFFRYMMEHFEIDLLGEYKTGPLHDTEMVINPAWRELERQRNTMESKLRYRRARFAAESLADIPGEQENKLRQREKRKAELLEEITAMTHELVKIKEQKKQTAHHIRWGDLLKEHQFEKPLLGRKRLMDAVRMIAYRSGTALCSLLTTPSLATTAARCLLQNLFTTEADISPDIAQGQLLVAIHRGSRPSLDRALEALFAKLNEMEIVFPGIELILHYQLVGSNPDQNSQKCVASTSQR